MRTAPSRILCIDSSARRLHELTDSLERSGFDVWTAHGASEAVCLASGLRFDVVVVDRTCRSWCTRVLRRVPIFVGTCDWFRTPDPRKSRKSCWLCYCFSSEMVTAASPGCQSWLRPEALAFRTSAVFCIPSPESPPDTPARPPDADGLRCAC